MTNWFFKTTALFGVLAMSLTACKKDEIQTTAEFSAVPVLTASTTNAGVLARTNANNTAVTYNWNPYSVTLSDNSATVSPVTYTVQLAKTGTNFASVQGITAAPGSSSVVLKTVDLNTALLALKLPFGQAAKVDVRLKTFVAGNIAPLYSATTTLMATPYDNCVAPSTDAWGLVGPAGDGWPGATATDRTMPYSCTDNAYVLRMPLNAGKFKFRANKDWATNLGGPVGSLSSGVPLTLSGPDLEVATAGTYTVKLVVTLDAMGKASGGTVTLLP